MTRLNGAVFALNPDLVERVDATPDTVVSLLDGTKYIIAESVPRFIELVREHRASVIALAHQMEDDPELEPPTEPNAARVPGETASNNVVQLQRRKR
ncbi:flagellar FlbD family protein [Luedemannella flava]